MYDDIEVLEYIYESAIIAIEEISHVLKINNNIENINEILKNIIFNYRKIALSAKQMLERRNKKVKEIGMITKMISYMNIKLNINEEDKVEEVIQIIIQGCNISIDNMIKKINNSKIKRKSIINLANRFVMFEKETIEKIKIFLK